MKDCIRALSCIHWFRRAPRGRTKTTSWLPLAALILCCTMPAQAETVSYYIAGNGCDTLFNTNTIVGVNDDLHDTQTGRYRAQLELPAPHFSFILGGVPSTQLLGGWTSNVTDKVLDAERMQETTVYSDPASGLQIICRVTKYSDFPAEEWVLYFKNTGTKNTPIFENVNAADITLHRGNRGEFTLYYAKGCSARVNDFEPFHTQLDPSGLTSATWTFAPTDGRSSQDTAFPYYNVGRPGGGGDILAIGWSGEWSATFTRDGTTNLNIQAGMQLTHFVLYPGEEIRTPAILLLAYVGDRMSGQNLFRRLMERHYTPTPDDHQVVMPIAASPHGYIGLEDTSESNMVQTITNIAYNHMPVDTYWIDAGWFPYTNSWEFGGGNWFADPRRYPNGMEPVAHAAHTNGMKFLLWFEPERVMPGTALYRGHPDWLLAGDVAWGGVPLFLLNLGNPGALNWAETNFLAMIRRTGINIFRLDMNMPPLKYWRRHDATNRQGITEIKYITGLYRFLDYLTSNDPSLLIDNSSAAGHRLDFEMARRSVPLNRSDFGTPIGQQCMEYALSFWLPYQGGTGQANPYVFRSAMGEAAVYLGSWFGNPKDPKWKELAREINQYKSVRPYFLGDFYPLTPYSANNTSWLAYQFNRPDLGGGIVQAFRRDYSDVSSRSLPLFGLEPSAHYVITDFDNTVKTNLSGLDLMSQGLPIGIASKPGAVVYVYRKTR